MDGPASGRLHFGARARWLDQLHVMQIIRPLMLFVLATALVLSDFSNAESATMKAIVIHEYGGPEVLKYEDIPRPEPKDDQLLIRVLAAGVNPVDGMIRSGMFKG